MSKFPTSPRNKVKRLPKRGHYDEATVHAMLDAGFLCHISFVMDGQPFIIPTAFGRDGNHIYLHGSSKSRMMLHLAEGHPACIAVSHIDALVLARSIFHHSVNYRSAVLFGKGEKVEGEEKMHGLRVVSDQILKGRWGEVREPNEQEMKATTVIRFTIEAASAKVRTGPPGDDEPDYALPIWAGLLPLQQTWGDPVADPLLTPGISPGASVTDASGKTPNT